jgi:CRP-like cAMP-binding protein
MSRGPDPVRRSSPVPPEPPSPDRRRSDARVRDLRPRAAGGPSSVPLLQADREFAGAIPHEDLALAARVLVLPRLELAPGAWSPPPRDSWPAPTAGVLLVDGLAARHAVLGERVATQLLGPGDILDPWGAGGELLPCAVSWSVHTPVTAAVLDGRFATAARRWPDLAGVVQQRLGGLVDRLATHLAICQLPRVEQRLLALLWHLAERFGRVGPDGVVLSLGLTHRLIGQLVGAQRPTVSLAMGTLVEGGLVHRRADGAIVLTERSRDALEAETGLATTPRPVVRARTAARGGPARPRDAAPLDSGDDRTDPGAAPATERTGWRRALQDVFAERETATTAPRSRAGALRAHRAALVGDAREDDPPDLQIA